MLGLPQIGGAFDFRPYERNKIAKIFHNVFSMANEWKFANNYRKYEYLRRINSISRFKEEIRQMT